MGKRIWYTTYVYRLQSGTLRAYIYLMKYIRLSGFYLGFLVWGGGGGGKMLKVIVDGGCSHRPQFSRGVWGHAPPPPPPEFFEF